LEAQQKAVYSHVNILNSFGSTTKEYFPNVGERLKIKLNLTQNFKAIVTGHGKTKAYLHRFKII
jgi:hypothetical protein